MPRLEGPESRHQKYFLQSRGCGKNPSSVHLKSVDKKNVKLAHLSKNGNSPNVTRWNPFWLGKSDKLDLVFWIVATVLFTIIVIGQDFLNDFHSPRLLGANIQWKSTTIRYQGTYSYVYLAISYLYLWCYLFELLCLLYALYFIPLVFYTLYNVLFIRILIS